jgi:hypothetical protein
MIKLHKYGNWQGCVYINPNHIVAIEEGNSYKGTKIYLIGGAEIEVNTAADRVLEFIEAHDAV